MISINIELSFCNYSVTFTILYAFFIRLSSIRVFDLLMHILTFKYRLTPCGTSVKILKRRNVNSDRVSKKQPAFQTPCISIQLFCSFHRGGGTVQLCCNIGPVPNTCKSGSHCRPICSHFGDGGHRSCKLCLSEDSV